MKSKSINNGVERIFVLILDQGEEAFKAITDFADLIGDVAQGDDGKASLHLHAVLGLQVGTLRGGHFLSGSVQPTLEVTITESVVHLRRKKRPDLGIALINV